MEGLRKPFQGVTNIIRFNWHFYAIAFAVLLLLGGMASLFGNPLCLVIYFIMNVLLLTILISLLTSYYIYDVSDFYLLKWMEHNNSESLIVNIHAGFDENSHLIQNKFNNAELIVLDFYNPQKHTEPSIQRARKAYPPFPTTQQIITTSIPLHDHSVDKLFVILSAHEIRNSQERLLFFNELHRVLKPSGQLYITEHLRDLPNFIAFNIGFFHFFPKKSWIKIIKKAHFKIQKTEKLNPWITNFILTKNGTTL